MPTKAFLHKKSLLDQFKDDYKSTGYIQSARAEHTWSNPLTRRKRTNKLNGWIKSFQGKRHVHKLARFNAMQNENLEEAMSLKGFLSNISDKLVNKYGLDKNKVQNYLGSHTQEMQELLDDKELSLKEKAEFVRSEITGEKDEKKSEFYMNDDDSEDYYYCQRCGRVTPSYELDAHGGFCSDCDARWTAEHENESKEHEGFVGVWQSKIMQGLEAIKGKYGFDIESDEITDPRHGVTTVYDIIARNNGLTQNLAQVGPEYFHTYTDADFVYSKPFARKDYTDTEAISKLTKVIKDFYSQNPTMARSEAVEPTDEKLGYEKGHKNSRGEDAPWVIRSHEDNRILASFANKKDAKEHLKRMKQYSKQEAYVDNSATAQKDYVERVISAVQDYYGYSLFDAKNLVQRNAKKVKDWYMSGEVSDVEAARCLGENCEPTKKAETYAGDINDFIEDIIDRFYMEYDYSTKNVRQFCKYFKKEIGNILKSDGGDKFEQVRKLYVDWAGISEAKEVTEDEGKEALRKLSKRGELPYGNNMRIDGLSLSRIADEIRYDVATALDMAAEACEDAMLDYGYDRIYVAIADGKTPAEVAADIKGSKKTESTDDDLRSRMNKIGYDLLENGNLHSWEYDFIKECLAFSEFKKLEQYLIRKGWYTIPTEAKQTEGIHLEFEDTLQVPEWLWKAYMLDDTTDLEEDEIEKLNDFREKYKDYHLDDKGEDPYFSSRNDFDELGGNVYDVDAYKMSDKPTEKKSESKNEALKDFPDGTNYKFTFGFHSPKTANIAKNAAEKNGYVAISDKDNNVSFWTKDPQDAIRFADTTVNLANEDERTKLERSDVDKAFAIAIKNKDYSENKETIDNATSEYAVVVHPFESFDGFSVMGELTDVVDFLETIK